ncbi:MAG: discoidin domain-containing protein [Anaerolineae bacterium]|nr:discoidin domain-containing protein [Anaerolineae bacterium]
MTDFYPPYIFGMHDRGAEHLMLQKSRRGWVLVTEAIGADPNNYSGSNYTDLTNQGLGVIVRLNNGYGSGGTIPNSSQYNAFAVRCGNFAAASPGCHIWIIGNEMNLSAERPGGPQGQTITPQLYANCFQKCRAQIRSQPGHGEDQVVVGAVGPWNTETKYAGNPNGDWVQYLADILTLLGEQVDAISLHTYTHGQAPDLVFNDATMNPPFGTRHFHFYAYRDFMGAIPASLRDRPVYITETDQYGAWRDANTGWVRNAYREIDSWNRNPLNQPIQALILYRWIIGNPNSPQEIGWAIENKPGVQADFLEAMNNAYQVVLAPAGPEYLAAWISVSAPTLVELGATVSFAVTVRNAGTRPWPSTGADAVAVGYRWLGVGGAVIVGHAHTPLPGPVAPGESITVPAMTVRAPAAPGFYTLELDMVSASAGWFAALDSPTYRVPDVQAGPRYRARWLSVNVPAEGVEGETASVPVRVRNDGALTWTPGGNNPIQISYHWLDQERNVVVADGLRTPLPRAVAPGEEVAVNASLKFPNPAGSYILQMDMVHEFVTWFQWKGSPVHEATVRVTPAVPEWAAHWIEYVGPVRLEIGGRGLALLRIKNTGTATWPATGAAAVRLGYRWYTQQGAEVPVAGAEQVRLPGAVPSGDTVVLREVPLVAPATPGTYRLVWDLVQQGVWLSTRGVGVLEKVMQVVPPEYAVSWSVVTPWPAWIPPASVYHATIRIKNTGTRTWTKSGPSPVHLAYTWFTADGKLSEPWDTFHVPLPAHVAPGSTATVADVPVKTPAVPGQYLLRWDLVEEGETWFFRRGAAPLEVPIEISDRSLIVAWNATASHNPAEVALAFDGDPNSVWDSKADQVPGMWFQVDMGQVLTIDRVKISSPGRGFPLGYRLLLSEDGQDWRVAAQAARNWTDIDAAFVPCAARYVRIEQIGTAEWPATWMISEMAVAVTKAWAGATASHYADDTHEALDCNLSTAWNTRAVKQKPGMWFQVDMGEARRIQQVALQHPASQMARGYVVSVSENGTSWQEVGRNDDNWGTINVSFTPRPARYVRVETTNSSTYHPWGIAEFVVWRTEPVWTVGRKDK